MNTQKKTIEILTSIFLALTCISFGYAMCAGIPFITERVAFATIDDQASPFDTAELTKAAQAIREYSFGSHSEDALYESIVSINNEANTPYANTTLEEIKDAPEAYTITDEQLSHLNDVYDVSSRMMMPIFGIVALAIFLLMIGLKMFGSDITAKSLKWGGIITLALLALTAIFAFVAFDAFFAIFHAILFSGGNWQFASDSLMITALPEGFWAAMAGVWMAFSVLLGAISLALGLIMLRKKTAE